MLRVCLIGVFLFLHHVCFLKQAPDVYAVLQGSIQWFEMRNFCLCHLTNLPHIIDMERMLCINKKRRFVLSQQRRGKSSIDRIERRWAGEKRDQENRRRKNK